MIQLTLEQQFTVASFNSLVDKMSHEQAQEMLKMIHQHYIVQKHLYSELIKQQWFSNDVTNQRPTA